MPTAEGEDRLLLYVLWGTSPSLSFGAVRVVATPNARLTGLCDGPLDGLCNDITHYKQRIKDQVESNFMAVLDTRQVRDQVAVALRPQLDGMRIGSIQSVEVAGAELVIRYLRDR